MGSRMAAVAVALYSGMEAAIGGTREDGEAAGPNRSAGHIDRSGTEASRNGLGRTMMKGVGAASYETPCSIYVVRFSELRQRPQMRMLRMGAQGQQGWSHLHDGRHAR